MLKTTMSAKASKVKAKSRKRKYASKKSPDKPLFAFAERPKKLRVSIAFLEVSFFVKTDHSLWCRMAKGKRSLPLNTGHRVDPSKFDAATKTIIGNPALSMILQQFELFAMNIYQESVSKGERPTLSFIKAKALERFGNTFDVPTYMECQALLLKQIRELAKGKRVADKSYRHLLTYGKRIGEFIQQRLGKKDLALADIKAATGHELSAYLMGERRFGDIHARKIVGFMKRVLEYAICQDYISKNPLDSIKIERKRPTIKYLTDTEVEKLADYPFENETFDRVRDCFLFQIYTGLAYAELKRLHRSHIKQDPDGSYHISINRAKNDQLCLIPLLPHAHRILEKYKSYASENKGLLLPVLSNQKMNMNLHAIGEMMGLGFKLTTHIGRKSCATMLLNNGVSISSVRSILGHSTTRQTELVYAALLPQTVKREMAEFALKKPL